MDGSASPSAPSIPDGRAGLKIAAVAARESRDTRLAWGQTSRSAISRRKSGVAAQRPSRYCSSNDCSKLSAVNDLGVRAALWSARTSRPFQPFRTGAGGPGPACLPARLLWQTGCVRRADRQCGRRDLAAMHVGEVTLGQQRQLAAVDEHLVGEFRKVTGRLN